MKNHQRRALLVPLAGLLLVIASACGGEAKGSDDRADAPDLRCLPDAPACDDTPVDPEQPWDAARIEQARQEARQYLGQNEDDLPDGIRVGRRGEEWMALTMDLVPGRITVELDDVEGTGFRVVTVTLELPDGSESFDLQPG